MNKRLKNALKTGFEAPAPQRKNVFLNSIEKQSVSCFEFVVSQTAYIRKWVWVLSALMFVVAFIVAKYMNQDTLWCISALMPLLALSVITESSRSETYGMAEFELSARFSLKSVVLARLGILGIANLILMGMLVPLAFLNSNVTLLQTGVYMLCPYLLTVALGLWAARKIHGKEAVYFCTAIAISVSLAESLLYHLLPAFYAGHSFIFWIAASLILTAGTANQCSQTIKQTEELAWN